MLLLSMKKYFVSNDTILVASKSNKCEQCQQKINTPLTNKIQVLVGNYFYTHVSHLLGFDMDDVYHLIQNTFSYLVRASTAVEQKI